MYLIFLKLFYIFMTSSPNFTLQLPAPTIQHIFLCALCLVAIVGNFCPSRCFRLQFLDASTTRRLKSYCCSVDVKGKQCNFQMAINEFPLGFLSICQAMGTSKNFSSNSLIASQKQLKPFAFCRHNKEAGFCQSMAKDFGNHIPKDLDHNDSLP